MINPGLKASSFSNLETGLYRSFFSCPIFLSPFTPLWWVPYCIPQSLLIFLGLFLYSSQLLRRRLSLIANSTSIGCRVGWVELRSRINESAWPSARVYHRTNLLGLHSLSLRGCVFDSSNFFDSDCEVARFPLTCLEASGLCICK